jgi:pSer/pThr/pTyr-binding forkhead associated (FHA) protein
MTRRFTIGRDRQCDVPLLDDSVSRRHAEIWLADDGTLMIADLRSSNGTRLIRNGASSVVNESAVLPGDKVRFGVVKVDVGALVDAVENANPGALTPVRIARIRCVCGVLKSPGEVCPGCAMTCGGSNG